ncbi:DinB family protein [Parasegetibacter sp. NRK P23]|uniref:DinB family protein n=1 Tax=Parasegetibacter sp. NRK P23 TaxID=2942999 RepID=UPI002043D80F|nr:DinB family protein [Parasegetibacter sp. NRK P23]MCM5530353.1 DinB family protein [Parasegetibacter sp. NRK P23]
MSGTSTTVANRLREVFLNGHFIANTNYREQLQDLNWMQATQKTGNFNTIAALTYHINYYMAGILDAFETGKLTISDKYSFDLPPIQAEQDWQHLVVTLLSNAEKLADAIEKMTADKLSQPFFDEKYGTYQRNMEAVIEHSYYHLAQIVLLKKIVADSHQ